MNLEFKYNLLLIFATSGFGDLEVGCGKWQTREDPACLAGPIVR